MCTLLHGARIIALPASVLKHGPSGLLNRVQRVTDFAEFLLVEPGKGAWALTAGDGGQSDADGKQDGTVTADLSDVVTITGNTKPSKFNTGDVLIVVDANTLNTATLSLTTASLTGDADAQ